MGTNEPSYAMISSKSLGSNLRSVYVAFSDTSHLKFLQMHGYGTNLEGPWSEVTKAIYDCHAAVHANGSISHRNRHSYWHPHRPRDRLW
ncbi:hypothetical protein EV363DRAFT_737051 [Boletus edulis]|nr:hypothetical protein EV363DRAFT_737051 [Boletus edulis]